MMKFLSFLLLQSSSRQIKCKITISIWRQKETMNTSDFGTVQQRQFWVWRDRATETYKKRRRTERMAFWRKIFLGMQMNQLHACVIFCDLERVSLITEIFLLNLCIRNCDARWLQSWALENDASLLIQPRVTPIKPFPQFRVIVGHICLTTLFWLFPCFCQW